MPEQVIVKKDLGIIEILSFEEVVPEQMARSIETVERIYDETGIDKVLVDTRGLEIMPGTVDMFELTKSFPKYLKIAILVRFGGDLRTKLEFGENVAFNRGVTIRMFDFRAEAVEWLQS